MMIRKSIQKKVLFVRAQPIIKGPTYDRIPALLSDKHFTVAYLGWDREKKYSPKENNGHYLICRFQHASGAGWSKYAGFVRFWLWIFRFARRWCPDVIHACDINVILPALLYKFIAGKKMVFQLYDFSADEQLAGHPLFKSVFGWIEKHLISLADGVILVSEAQRSRQLSGIRLKKELVVHNTPADLLCETRGRAGPRRRRGRLCICYGGNVRDSRGLDTLCRVAIDRPFDVIVAGGGPYLNTLKERYDRHKNITFLGEISHRDILLSASQSDVIYACYKPIRNNVNMVIGSPNKYFESLMLGKPLITNEESGIAVSVRDSDTGFTVPYDDVHALETLLFSLNNKKREIESRGKRARRIYEERYHWSFYQKKILRFYHSLWKGRNEYE